MAAPLEALATAGLARSLFAEAGDALFIVRPDTEAVVEVNPAALRLTRLPREALVGRPSSDVVRDERDAADWLASVHETRTFHGRDGFLLRTDRPGGWVPVSLTISRLHVPDADPLALFTVRDRSDAVEAYRRVQRTEAELRRVLVSVSDTLWSCRAEPGGPWRYRYLSPVVERLTGHPVAHFLDDPGRWADIVHPPDRARWRDFRAALAAGRSGELEYRLNPAGGPPRWVRESVVAAPEVEEPGGLLLHGIVTDVTERKAAERAELERNLLETQRLDSLGVLAGGVAHDFNNLLTGILGNASLARLELPPGAATSHLEQIEAIALRAADLCKQMLAYAGKSRFAAEPLDLNALLRETTDLVRVSLAKRVRLDLALTPGLPPVRGDATQLRQVVMNLVLNASEAVGDRDGLVRLRTSAAALAAGRPGREAFALEAGPGEYVVLEVCDDGAGIDPEVLPRVFEPFFTTKFTGRGLGLAAVLGIVRGHGGAIQVESSPGRGSAFRVYLPALPAEAAEPRVAAAPPAEAATVLVVDDEEFVRGVARRLLESAGLRVVAAAGGDEALAVAAREGERVRLVLLDLTMPHMSGEEAFAALRRLRPGLPVVVMSGYAEPDVMARFGGGALAGYLPKPFRPGELFAALRRALPGVAVAGE